MKQDKEWEYQNKVNELNMIVQHMIADFVKVDKVLSQLENTAEGDTISSIPVSSIRKHIQRYVIRKT